MIGSPIVFHTAPPQPSSNALATWTYVLVGGPDASQNGLGDLMPAKLTERSATGSPEVQQLLGACDRAAEDGVPAATATIEYRQSTVWSCRTRAPFFIAGPYR